MLLDSYQIKLKKTNKMRELKTKLNTNSFYLGIKKGYNISILPEKIDTLYNLIYVRILRVIGGISYLLVLTSKYLMFPLYLQKVILILGLIQSLQMLIIFIIKIIYGIYTLIYKSKEF
nr:hypothetical protein FP1181M_0430 [Fomitopsis pinicola]